MRKYVKKSCGLNKYSFISIVNKISILAFILKSATIQQCEE